MRPNNTNSAVICYHGNLVVISFLKMFKFTILPLAAIFKILYKTWHVNKLTLT